MGPDVSSSEEAAALSALNRSGAFEAAQERGEAALRHGADSAEIAVELATAYAKQLVYDRAVEEALRARRAASGHTNVYLLATRIIVLSLTHMGMPELASPYIEQLGYSASPHCSDRCWPGRLWMMAGFTERALAEFEAIAAHYPEHPFVRNCLGNARLALGDSGGAVDEMAFASREFWKHFYPAARAIERMWEGGSLAGRSIAILPHGGFGDYFQYLRYVPALRAAGVREIVAIARWGCHRLIASSGVDRVADLAEMEVVKDEVDCWVGSYGLGRLGLMTGDRVGQQPYLAASHSERSRAAVATIRACAGGRACIGIYWHSDADDGELKSLRLSDLLPLFAMPDVHWVILQRGFGLRRLRVTGLDMGMSVLVEDLDFDDTAAIIAGLDAVVSICAWSLHLAGALGVRTWLLAGRVLNPRHENREHASVLYPGIVTLARQARPGDWSSAVAVVARELRAWLAAHGGEQP